jgi:uncharacterized protein with PQ loop repeat
MTSAEIALAVFAICNSIRVFAYVPQIVAVARDQRGASAISYTTWGLFAVSHLSTVTYALLVINDWRMAAVFIANTVCCLAIVGLTVWKRAVYKAVQRLTATAAIASPDQGPAEQGTEEHAREHPARADHPLLLVVTGGKDVAVQPR